MDPSDLVRCVVGILEEQRIAYMVVGSLASSTYGQARFTMDVDIVVDLTAKQADALCAAFPMPDYYVSREATQEAVRLRRQFNVIHPASGMKIDFMLARSDPWGRSQLARRQRVQILPGFLGYVAAPEDIIIAKMLYYKQGGSEKHLRDITAILKESPDKVDRAYVEYWTEELGLKEIWGVILKRLAGAT